MCWAISWYRSLDHFISYKVRLLWAEWANEYQWTGRIFAHSVRVVPSSDTYLIQPCLSRKSRWLYLVILPQQIRWPLRPPLYRQECRIWACLWWLHGSSLVDPEIFLAILLWLPCLHFLSLASDKTLSDSESKQCGAAFQQRWPLRVWIWRFRGPRGCRFSRRQLE